MGGIQLPGHMFLVRVRMAFEALKASPAFAKVFNLTDYITLQTWV